MFGTHKRRHGVFAVYDISSSSVGGCHVLLPSDQSKKGVFLATTRENASLPEHLSVDRLVDTTKSNLEKVVQRVRKADVHHPEMIQVILASPWYQSQTHTIVYKKEKPFLCSEKLVTSLIDAEIRTITASFADTAGAYGKESIIIEKQLSSLKLNGYHTNNPYGKHAATLEFSLMVTIAPKSIITLLSDTLRRAYGTRTIRFTTSSFASFIVMRDYLSLVDDECVVIDVGEEVTDVGFVKAGVLLYEPVFPVGTHTLYRSLAKEGKYSVAESIAILESYRFQKLSPQASSVVEKVITDYAALWQGAFRSMLDENYHGLCLPEKIFVVADARFEKIYTSILQHDPFIEQQCVSRTPAITFATEALFDSLVATTDQTALDIPLSIGALFVRRQV